MFWVAMLHGMAGWFDITFDGSTEKIVLDTAPECPGTHWYQCRLLLLEPIAVNRGQRIVGSVDFRANEGFSYDVFLEIQIEGTSVISKNRINLKDQVRRLLRVRYQYRVETYLHSYCSLSSVAALRVSGSSVGVPGNTKAKDIQKLPSYTVFLYF